MDNLDAHFGEDFCSVEDKNVQQNLNIIRKIVLNSIKQYKEKYDIKRPFSKIMLDCLLDPYFMLSLLAVGENWFPWDDCEAHVVADFLVGVLSALHSF